MKATVKVTQIIEVEIDESRFTPEFMDEFKEVFYRFNSIDKHIEHLAQLTARGIINDIYMDQFVEGYGRLDTMGITVRDLDDTEVEIIEGGEVAV